MGETKAQRAARAAAMAENRRRSAVMAGDADSLEVDGETEKTS